LAEEARPATKRTDAPCMLVPIKKRLQRRPRPSADALPTESYQFVHPDSKPATTFFRQSISKTAQPVMAWLANPLRSELSTKLSKVAVESDDCG
jgi:hypothetical protein